MEMISEKEEKFLNRLFDSLTDLAAEVIASPVTLTAKAIDVTIKTAEAIPEVAEKTIDKIEKAVDKIGE